MLVRRMTQDAEATLEPTPVAVICSAGRPGMLHASVLQVVGQTVPCRVVLSVIDEADVLPETRLLAGVSVVCGPRGSSRQRNLALASIAHRPECVLFLDDDVELDREYVREILACYRRHPPVAVVNGRNLAHGIYPAGTLDRPLARTLLTNFHTDHPELASVEPGSVAPMATSYGCRMSFRGTLLGKVSFDERLVLYGFLEDLDLALQCRRFGEIVEATYALGVHLEVSSGRMGSKRRGYSEVINALYLWRKGTGFALSRAVLGSLRRTAHNAARAVRTGDGQQLAGNLLGWLDAARGRLEPERILEL